MKIAYLTNCFGTQSHTFMRREIRALRELGVELSLYGIRKDESGHAADVNDLVEETHYLYPVNKSLTLSTNLHYLMSSPIRYLKNLFSAFASPEFSFSRRMKMVAHYFLAAPVARHMESSGITHIHAQFLNVSSSIAMYAAAHVGIPFSVTVHSAGSFKAADTVGLHEKLRKAQFLIMISHYNVDYYDAVSPCRHKSYVVRCGMNLEDFTFHAPSDRAANSDAITHKTRLLGVGRFVAKKGFHYLIEAAAILKHRKVDFELRLVGNGPLDDELRTLANRLHVSDCVKFLGQKSTHEVRAEMTEADIVVVPSVTTNTGDMEGLPVVIMEAMATGTAVVASDHAGIPEIVIPGQTGFLTPERDAESIADAVCELIKNPPVEMLTRARLLIEDNFNIATVARHRQDIFNRHDQVR